MKKIFSYLFIALFVFCAGFCLNINQKAYAMISAEFDEEVTHENKITKATLANIAGEDFTVYIMKGTFDSITVNELKEKNYGTFAGKYVINQHEYSITINSRLDKGEYTLVYVANSYENTIDFDDIDSKYTRINFTVSESDSIDCFYHWIMIILCVSFIVFAVIYFVVLKKNKFNVYSIVACGLFVVLSLVFGIIGLILSCTLCLIFLIVNVLVAAGFATWLLLNKKEKKKERKRA